MAPTNSNPKLPHVCLHVWLSEANGSQESLWLARLRSVYSRVSVIGPSQERLLKSLSDWPVSGAATQESLWLAHLRSGYSRVSVIGPSQERLLKSLCDWPVSGASTQESLWLARPRSVYSRVSASVATSVIAVNRCNKGPLISSLMSACTEPLSTMSARQKERERERERGREREGGKERGERERERERGGERERERERMYASGRNRNSHWLIDQFYSIEPFYFSALPIEGTSGKRQRTLFVVWQAWTETNHFPSEKDLKLCFCPDQTTVS